MQRPSSCSGIPWRFSCGGGGSPFTARPVTWTRLASLGQSAWYAKLGVGSPLASSWSRLGLHLGSFIGCLRECVSL
jgi:hypothetical protein